MTTMYKKIYRVKETTMCGGMGCKNVTTEYAPETFETEDRAHAYIEAQATDWRNAFTHFTIVEDYIPA